MGVWTSTPGLSLEAMCQVSCDADLGQGSHRAEGGLLVRGPVLNPHLSQPPPPHTQGQHKELAGPGPGLRASPQQPCQR